MDNQDAMKKCYEEIAAGANNEWDVFASDAVADMMAEAGAENWGEDRIAMQYGMERMRWGISELPATVEECRSLVITELDNQLSAVDSSIVRDNGKARAVYAKILATCEDTDESVYQSYRLWELKEAVADAALDMLRDTILPTMMGALEQESESEPLELRNPGAAAAAEYLTNPQARDCPELLGSSAELCRAAVTLELDPETITEYLADGLQVLAVSAAVSAILDPVAGTLAGSPGHVIKEGTVAGVAAAVAEEWALSKPLLLAGLKTSVVSGALAGLRTWLHELFGSNGQVSDSTNVYDYS